VEVSDEMTRKIRAAIDRAAPWLVPAVESEVVEVVDNARRNWIVGERSYKNGKLDMARFPHSRDLFETSTVIELGQGAIRGRITNKAAYWLFIKGSPATSEIRVPLRKRSAKLAEELAKILRDQMGAR
jgi:hypothetical protein